MIEPWYNQPHRLKNSEYLLLVLSKYTKKKFDGLTKITTDIYSREENKN